MMKTKGTIIDYYYTIKKEFHPWQLVNELSAVFWLTTPRGWSVNIGQLVGNKGQLLGGKRNTARWASSEI